METTLIEITWNNRDGAADFTIPAKHDSIILNHRAELISMLEYLTYSLQNGKYPFSFLSEQPNP